MPGRVGEREAGERFDRRIAGADPGAASRALAAKEEPREHRDVLARGEARIEPAGVGEDADAPAHRVDVHPGGHEVHALHADAAAGGFLQPVAAAQERALARAGGPDDEHQLAGGDREVDRLQHLEVAEGLVQPPDLETRIAILRKKTLQERLTVPPDVLEFIASKMWEFFAYRNPEPALISRLSLVFRDSGMEIKPLLRAIMSSPEFYSAKAERAIYKNPVDFVVATSRQLGIGEMLGDEGRGALRPKVGPLGAINQTMKGMGMQLFYPPDVSGWSQGAAWVSTATMVQRIAWADRLFPSTPESRALLRIDASPLFAGDPSPSGVAKKLVSIFDAPLAESKLRNLAEAARKAMGAGLDERNANTVAASVSRLLFASPEFQFC